MTVAAIGNTGNAARFSGARPRPSYFMLNPCGGSRRTDRTSWISVSPVIPTSPHPRHVRRAVGQLARHSHLLPQLRRHDHSRTGASARSPATDHGDGNGSTELITWTTICWSRTLAVPIPTFGRWTDQPDETGKRVDMFRLPERHGFALDPMPSCRSYGRTAPRTAVICNPDNAPTAVSSPVTPPYRPGLPRGPIWSSSTCPSWRRPDVRRAVAPSTVRRSRPPRSPGYPSRPARRASATVTNLRPVRALQDDDADHHLRVARRRAARAPAS